MKCEKCGNKIKIAYNLCPKCGNRIEVTEKKFNKYNKTVNNSFGFFAKK